MLCSKSLTGIAVGLLLLTVHSAARGQVLAVPYAGPYTLVDLGSVPGLPTNYGGLCFLNNNTMLIGGNANTAAGQLFAINVVRNATNNIIGFSGVASVYKNAPDIDGGVTFDSNGVLLCTTFPSNNLLMYKVGGGINPDKVVNLTGLGIALSTGSLVFVPAGFPGAGTCRLISWSASNVYSCTLTPDGLGTYNVGGVVLQTGLAGAGPEGEVYVPAGSPVFNPANQYTIFSEYSSNRVSAYQINAAGNPILASRTDFVTGLVGAEGGFLDPVTNDFLFSTFGGSNKVIRVSGFKSPPGTGGSSGGSSSGEGTYAGSHGAGSSGIAAEGGYGFGGETPSFARLKLPILQHPIPSPSGGFVVVNVSQQQKAHAAGHADPGTQGGTGLVEWTLLAAGLLGIGMVGKKMLA